MKKNLLKIFALSAMCFVGAVSTSCSDDDNDVPAADVSGVYKADFRSENGEVTKYAVDIVAEWNEKGAPQFLGTTLDEFFPMIKLLASVYADGGLESLELTKDNCLKASYHEVSPDGNVLSPQFKPEVLNFPTAGVPQNFITYSVTRDIIRLGVSKEGVKAMGEMQTPAVDAVAILEGYIKECKLPIKSDGKRYYMNFKFKQRGTDLYIYVDRGMMLPFKEGVIALITKMAAGMPDLAPIISTLPVNELFENSKKLEIGFSLKKK